MKLRLVAVVGLTIVSVQPALAQQTMKCDGPPDACRQLADFAAGWDAAFNKHDAVALAALYTPDAIIVSEEAIVHGREAIEKMWTDAFYAGWSSILNTVDQAQVVGDMAWWVGDWSATGPGPNHSTQPFQGKWGEVLVRDGGAWKIRMNTSNTMKTAAQ